MGKPSADCTTYIDDVRVASRFFSRDEEQALARAMLAGDKAARERLILSILPLAINIAGWYYRNGHNRGLPYDELIQLGNMGVIAAVDRFDPDLGYRLTTYATAWIQQKIRTEVSRGGIHVVSKGREAAWLAPVTSHENYMDDDTAAAWEVPFDPLADMGHDESLRRLADAMATLLPADRSMIEARIHGEHLQDIGNRMGLSRERARQIEMRAIRRLCAALGVPDCGMSLARMGFVGTRKALRATNPA